MGIAPSGRDPVAEVAALDQSDARRGGREPDVGQDHLTAELGTVAEEQSGLQGGEGHGSLRSGRRTVSDAGHPVEPRGDVDREHPDTLGDGTVVSVA